MPTKTKMGRRAKVNRGYWYRAGRGWMATVDGRQYPLCDAEGVRLTDRNLDKSPKGLALLATAAAAHADQLEAEASASDLCEDQTQVASLAKLYLAWAKKELAGSTYDNRSRFLFDFVSGFAPRWRKHDAKPNEKDRIHQGYGQMQCGEVKVYHIEAWVAAHPTWAAAGGVRMAKQSVRGMFCWGQRQGLLSKNPIRGIKVKAGNKRHTFFTQEQEDALLAEAVRGQKRMPFWFALTVCIRLGLRPKEFAKMEAHHIEATKHGMRLRYTVSENKTGGQTGEVRLVYVPATIATLISERAAMYPQGKLWRNTQGRPWSSKSLQRAFEAASGRVEKKKGIRAASIRQVVAEVGARMPGASVEAVSAACEAEAKKDGGIKGFFDADSCFYSCRHTFAKRTLGGWWTGKPCTIEQLAKLMGNSVKVCWEHYAHWCDAYTDPLWDAVG